MVMSPPAFAILPTAIGAFGVAWGDAGIVRTWMHEPSVEATRRQVLRAYPRAIEQDPPGAIAQAMTDVAALLAGASRSSDVALDTRSIPPFDRRVYEVVYKTSHEDWSQGAAEP